MATLDISRIKDQSQGPLARELGEALRNRASSNKATTEALADATFTKEDQVVRWLAGWDIPKQDDLEAMLPLLGLEKVEPDIPAIKKTNGTVLKPAGYTNPTLAFKDKTRTKLMELRAGAEAERKAITPDTLAPFDQTFLEFSTAQAQREGVKLDRARRKIIEEVKGHYLLKAAITAPLSHYDTVASFVDSVCEYYGTNSAELCEHIGFGSNVLLNWKKGTSLPHRDSFLTFRDWVEHEFGHQTANKITHLFIKDALERHQTMTHLRNLPPEFWAWKMQITNHPECAFSTDQPSWGEFVKPITTRQEYEICFRRAATLFGEEFCGEVGLEINKLRQFEAGQGSGTLDGHIITACEELDAQRTARGEPALFDRAKFEALPAIQPKAIEGGHAERARRGRPPKVKVETPEPEFTEAQRTSYADIIRAIPDEKKRAALSIPESLEDFAKLREKDIETITMNAKRYMWLPKNNKAFEIGLKNLHGEVNTDKAAHR